MEIANSVCQDLGAFHQEASRAFIASYSLSCSTAWHHHHPRMKGQQRDGGKRKPDAVTRYLRQRESCSLAGVEEGGQRRSHGEVSPRLVCSGRCRRRCKRASATIRSRLWNSCALHLGQFGLRRLDWMSSAHRSNQKIGGHLQYTKSACFRRMLSGKRQLIRAGSGGSANTQTALSGGGRRRCWRIHLPARARGRLDPCQAPGLAFCGGLLWRGARREGSPAAATWRGDARRAWLVPSKFQETAIISASSSSTAEQRGLRAACCLVRWSRHG